LQDNFLSDSLLYKPVVELARAPLSCKRQSPRTRMTDVYTLYAFSMSSLLP